MSVCLSAFFRLNTWYTEISPVEFISRKVIDTLTERIIWKVIFFEKVNINSYWNAKLIESFLIQVYTPIGWVLVCMRERESGRVPLHLSPDLDFITWYYTHALESIFCIHIAAYNQHISVCPAYVPYIIPYLSICICMVCACEFFPPKNIFKPFEIHFLLNAHRHLLWSWCWRIAFSALLWFSSNAQYVYYH